jgi:hypothetical protein
MTMGTDGSPFDKLRVTGNWWQFKKFNALALVGALGLDFCREEFYACAGCSSKREKK